MKLWSQESWPFGPVWAAKLPRVSSWMSRTVLSMYLDPFQCLYFSGCMYIFDPSFLSNDAWKVAQKKRPIPYRYLKYIIGYLQFKGFQLFIQNIFFLPYSREQKHVLLFRKSELLLFKVSINNMSHNFFRNKSFFVF